MSVWVGVCWTGLGPPNACVWQKPPETSRKACVCVCLWDSRVHTKQRVCVIATVVVVTEGDSTQKILAWPCDPKSLVAPIRSLPPSCQPSFLLLSSTSSPSFPLWGSSLAQMEVWSSSWEVEVAEGWISVRGREAKKIGKLILFMSFLQPLAQICIVVWWVQQSIWRISYRFITMKCKCVFLDENLAFCEKET